MLLGATNWKGASLPLLLGVELLKATPFVDWQINLIRCVHSLPYSTPACSRARRCEASAARGFAASWMFSSRRKALILLGEGTAFIALPNVRANRAATAGRQARAGENVPRTTGPGLVACRWRSG